MSREERLRQIKFIESDTRERGEDITSGITFFGCIYSVDVEKNGKPKTVTYSAAENPLKGYRKIKND